MNRNIVFTIFGVSGVGKTSLQKYLKKQYHVLPIITHTTRKKRNQEKDGVDYHFNTVSQFKKLDLMEDTKYDGNYYGSAKNDLVNAWHSGHHLLSIALDYKGILAYMKKLPKHIIPIYLFSDEQTVINRLKHRGTPKNDIKSRLAEHQNKLDAIYDVIFNQPVRVFRVDATNISLEHKTIRKIIKNPKSNWI